MSSPQDDADTLHLLSTLTDEERAAMADDAPSDAEIASLKALAGPDAGDEDDEDDGASAAAPASAPAAAAPAPTPAAAPAEPPAAAPVPTPAPRAPASQPAGYIASLPEGFEAKSKQLGEDSIALAKRFKDGEIEFDAFQTESANLQAQRDALTVQRAKAEISQEMRAQSGEQAWRSAVESFMAKAAEAGVDYKTDTARGADLDAFVKVLAANPAHDDKSMDWFLAEAHKRVLALHGAPATAPAPTPAAAPAVAADAKTAIAAATARRAPPVAQIPVTLAQVPGSDGPGDVGSEFAHIDLLDGEQLEAALAALPASQRERYLAGA